MYFIYIYIYISFIILITKIKRKKKVRKFKRSKGLIGVAKSAVNVFR